MADSNSSNNMDWVKLTESDYAKVIFKDVKKQYSPADIRCSFEISEDVKPSPVDYVGVFAVGFSDLNQCIASKKVANQKKQVVYFTVKELPLETMDFYQFLYVGENGAIHGASTPFLLIDSSEDVMTDEDFLIINPPENVDSSVAKQGSLEEKKEPDEQNRADDLVSIESNDPKIEEIGKNKLDVSEEKIIEELSERVEILEKELQSPPAEFFNKRISLLTEENELLRLQFEEYDKKLMKKDKMIAEINAELEEMQIKDKHTFEQISSVNSDTACEVILDLDDKVAKLTVENEHLQGELQCMKESIKRFMDTEAMLQALEASKKLCMDELKRLKERNKQLEEAFQFTENECSDIKKRYAVLLSELSEEKERSGQLALRCHVHEKRCRKLENTLNSMEKKVHVHAEVIPKVSEFAQLLKDALDARNIPVAYIDLKSAFDKDISSASGSSSPPNNDVDFDAMKLKCDGLTSELDKVLSQVSLMTGVLSNAQMKEDELKEKLNKSSELKEQYLRQLYKCVSEKKELDDKVVQLQEQITVLKGSSVIQSVYRKQAEQFHQENEELKKNNAALQLKVTEMENEVQALVSELEDMRKRLVDAANLYREQYCRIYDLNQQVKNYKENSHLASPNSTVTNASACKTAEKTLVGVKVCGYRLITDLNAEPEDDDDDDESDSDSEKMVPKYSPENAHVEDFGVKGPIAVESPKGCARSCGLFAPPEKCEPVKIGKETKKDVAIPVAKWPEVETTACYLCSEPLPLVGDNNTFLLNHLENVHNQKPCPVCGMMFENSLPPQYMKCHVDAHFN